MTISGVNFTSYSTTTGTFDTFESGSFASYWASHNNLNIGTANQRNSFSTRNATDTLTTASNDDAALQGSNSSSRQWYVSFWWKVGSNWSWGTSQFTGTDKWLSNIKIIRFWNSTGAATENIYLSFDGFNGSLYEHQEGHGEPLHALHVGPSKLTLNTWHEFRFEFVDSSAAGVADGSAKIFFDTMTIYNVTGQLYKTTEPTNKRPQRVGFQNEWGCTAGTPDTDGCPQPGDFYMDNVYAYDTIARVEICDQPVYTQCLQYPEIQHINSWTGTDINITYNEGSLSGTQYVFVVDNTGTASAGFQLDGPASGGGGGSETPHTGLSGLASLTGHAVMK